MVVAPRSHLIGQLRVNPNTRTAVLGDALLSLTPVEFDLLASLARARGRVRTREALLEEGFPEDQIGTFKIYGHHPAGCENCNGGYKGRVGIYEVMKVTPEIARIIMEDGNAIQIADASARAGFDNLRRSGLKKVMDGMTSLQEINRVTSE